MRTGTAARQERLVEIVRKCGDITTAELVTSLGVSPATLRRDVAALEQSGQVVRSHGRVRSPASVPAAEDSAGAVVGLLLPATGYYFSEILAGAKEAAARAGARIVLTVGGYHAERDEQQARAVVARGADGLLAVPTWLTGHRDAGRGDWLADLPVPVVLAERRAEPCSPADALDRVCSDHHYGAMLALRHLHGLGHRKVALVARRDSPTARAVRAGWLAARRAAGLELDVPHIEVDAQSPEGPNFERSVTALAELVKGGGATAALIHNDIVAIATVHGLAARGISVPGDLAVVSYDDEIAALTDLPMTAVAPPKHEVGRRAMEMLLRRMREGDALAPTHAELLPSLVVRASCGSPEYRPEP
ncbi:hypothetical protein BIV57_06090 [Mangrovactinospora gilvigrisea]|uniref:HTH deoR-type domain-containing protein n=1 Tax=Mangrovactinospora gilvigrisea TaxID=1428644 RepID=A0A1J7CF83_9ACTN|nr:substrate-binding domain-containing protein [Mangrovactinospora gilvigrisea]OIV38362.1 hypothetical protein BIV57_06090 [Mangrovactinospora gilvigrisea]